MKKLATHYSDITKEKFLEYGHVSVNVGGNDNGIRIVEGNKDTKGAVKLSDIELKDLLEGTNDGPYSKIEIANPIR